MDEKILTLHPQGKQGVNISKARYETVRASIVKALTDNDVLTFSQLTEAVRADFDGKFDGSINWYVTTVKLDLEARNVVERVPNSKPQQVLLAEKTTR